MIAPKSVSRLTGTLIKVEDKIYKADLELLDRYIGFSSEIVRLSLAGIAGIGFALSLLFKEGKLAGEHPPRIFIVAIIGALALLAVSAALALGHRYFAADGIYHHLRAIKQLILLEGGDTESPADQATRASVSADERRRNGDFELSGWLLLAAAGCLGLGVFSAGIGAGALLLQAG